MTKKQTKDKSEIVKRPKDDKILKQIAGILKSKRHCVIAFDLEEAGKSLKSEGMIIHRDVSNRNILQVLVKQLELDPAAVATAIIMGEI